MPNNIVSMGPSILTAFQEQSSDSLKNIYCNTANKILLKYQIENNNVHIIVNREQRPATYISGSQGDHVTAYTVLLQTICNLLDGEEERHAPKMLYEAVNCFFEDMAIFKFKSKENGKFIDFANRLKEIESQLFSKKARRKLTNLLSIIQDSPVALIKTKQKIIKESLEFIRSCNKKGQRRLNIKKLTNSIKRSNRVIFAQLVVELGEQILEKYNKQSTAALPKLIECHENVIGEGARVKLAMLNLKLLNRFLQLKTTVNELHLNSLIEDFKITCRTIIKGSFPHIRLFYSINKKFNDFLIMFFKINATKINLDNIAIYLDDININQDIKPKVIGKLFNDLFDFKQNRIRKIRQDNCGHNIEQEGQIVDNGNKIALQDPLRCLYEVTARHQKFMFTAFNGINNLPMSLRKKILDGFYDKIIEKSCNQHDNYQGWGQWVLDILPNGKNIYFTKLDLIKGVNEYHSRCGLPIPYMQNTTDKKLKKYI